MALILANHPDVHGTCGGVLSAKCPNHPVHVVMMQTSTAPLLQHFCTHATSLPLLPSTSQQEPPTLESFITKFNLHSLHKHLYPTTSNSSQKQSSLDSSPRPLTFTLLPANTPHKPPTPQFLLTTRQLPFQLTIHNHFFSNKNYAYPYYHNTNKMHVVAAKPTSILLVTTFSPAQLHLKSLHTMPSTTVSTTY